MKTYIRIIGFVVLVVAMLIMVHSSVDAASPTPVRDVGSTHTVSTAPANSGSPFAPGDLAHRREEKDSDSDSTAKSDDKAYSKPDLRTVDWNKAKNGAAAKIAANGNGDKNEEEDGDEEDEDEKESEGFDRLWDLATLG